MHALRQGTLCVPCVPSAYVPAVLTVEGCRPETLTTGLFVLSIPGMTTWQTYNPSLIKFEPQVDPGNPKHVCPSKNSRNGRPLPKIVHCINYQYCMSPTSSKLSFVWIEVQSSLQILALPIPPPSQYCLPPNTASLPIPPPITRLKSQIGLFKVILPPNTAVSEYRRFFARPKNRGIGRDDCTNGLLLTVLYNNNKY